MRRALLSVSREATRSQPIEPQRHHSSRVTLLGIHICSARPVINPILITLFSLLLAFAFTASVMSQETTADVKKDLYGDPIPSGAFIRFGSTRFKRHNSPCLAAVLPDNVTLLVVGDDLTYYSLATGEAIRKRKFPFPSLNVRDAVITPDHRSVAILGFSFSEEERATTYVAAVLDAVTGRLKFSNKSMDRLGESGIAISADGMTLAKSGPKTRIWDTTSGEEVLSYALEGIDYDSPIEFSADGETLFIGDRNKLVCWNWFDGATPQTYALAPKTKRVAPLSLAYSEPTNSLFIGTDSDILRFDLASNSIVDSFQESPMQPLGYISDMELTSDGQQLCAIGARNNSIAAEFWDIKTGEKSKTLLGACDSYRSVSISPNGKLVAMTSRWSNLMDVYEIESGKRLTEEYEGHRKSINFLTFDQNRLISAGDDRSLRSWNLDTGKKEFVLEHPASETGSSHWIRGSAVSPNGKYIATSSLDDTVRVWDGKTGAEIYVLAGHGRLGGSRCVGFSTDSRRLYSFGDDWRLYVYDLSNGKALRDTKLSIPGLQNRGDPFGGGEFLGGPCEFTADAKQLIIHIGGSVFVDTETAKIIRRLDVDSATSFRKSALTHDQSLMIAGSLGPRTQTPLVNGGMRVSAGKHHIVKLIKFPGDEVIAQTQFDDASPGPVIFAADKSFAVIASKKRESNAGTIRLLNCDNLEVLREIELVESWATELAMSEDRSLLAAALYDSTILVWKLDNL